ncbi:MAG: alpha/beta hydrolase [Dehalococcoidia bacterium]|nr:alpha/beta hydrolase [Dehalococcoidia bacterium]
MPIADVRGASINYEVLPGGDDWVVLTPGGRGELERVRIIGEHIADAGFSVLLHDRRNCGASDVVIDGDQSEQEIWADDLHELLRQLGASPAIAGGGSAGCRLSLLLALRHPSAVRGLLLWCVTGGQTAADRLGHNYYGQFIEAAEAGGMAAVCQSDFFSERISQNPGNRKRLMAMEPARFIEVMANWRKFFTQGADLPVIGATEEQLRLIDVPTCIIPGNDAVHPFAVGENLHRLLDGSELHDLRDRLSPVAADGLSAEQLLKLQDERQHQMAGVFVDFLQPLRTATAPAG